MFRKFSPTDPNSEEEEFHQEESSPSPIEFSELHQWELQRFGLLVTPSDPSENYVSPYPPATQGAAGLLSVPVLRSQRTPSPEASRPAALPREARSRARRRASPTMSSYSSSSQDDPIYSSPGPQQYTLNTRSMAEDPRNISESEKTNLIAALRTHRINTLPDLRRVEKIFAALASSDVTEPMTAAWAHYVNSNSLLSDLRGLTSSYPFSSECVDEAKWLVIGDPASTRSWNYCWLVLTKIRDAGLVAKHARLQAVKPEMWGGRVPTSAGAEQLARRFVQEWGRALRVMLGNWESPPTVTGR